MYRERKIRRTYGGHPVPRRPAYPRLLRKRPATAGNGTRLVARLTLALLLGALAIIAGVGGAGYSLYASTAASLKPRLDALENRQLFQSSRIYDRNGILLYEFFDTGKRTKVSIDEISPLLIQATIAIEDKTFYSNPGIDLRGILRTLISSLQAGEETGGASTITQQVIKNSVLTDEERAPERRYERKLKEIILAQELDKLYTKDQILELYLNENFYGNLAYGIEAASEVYFGVRARDLNLNQASLLAGLPQLPSVYNPINYLERDAQGGYLPGVVVGPGWLDPDYALPNDAPAPRRRQAAVLRRMVEDGYVSEAEARAALAEPLRFAPQEVPLNAPHFVFYVRDLLQERYGQETLFGGGLRITTTLDLNLQRMVQRKAYERISELRVRNIHNAAVVVMQPNTGQILAMVGSIDYNAIKPTSTPGETGNVLDGQVNVTTRERQPGSALKPFTYLAAMERGMTPETVIWDVPTEFPTGNAGFDEWYAPQNYNGRFNGPVRMRTALANSLNIPAVKALRFAGVQETLDLLDRVGIKSGLKRGKDFYGLSLTLGGGEVTPLELTTAYNTLASGGRYYPPVAVLQITDGEGRVLDEFTPRPGQQVVDPGLVAIISDMLSDDRARQAIWGLNSPLKLSLPAAVKTGTTNDWRDAWAAGYTPFVTVGVWTGNNNNEPTARVESLTGGGIIWRNVMEEIFAWIRNDPRYRALFAAPFPDGVIPTEFRLPADGSVQRRPICALPGPYGGYSEELFTRAMLAAMVTPTPQSVFGAPLAPTSPPPDNVELDQALNEVKVPCSAFRRVTVVRIPGFTDDGAEGEGAGSAEHFCRPVGGVSYPPELVRSLVIWKLPPPDPDMRERFVWQGGGVSALRVEALPACDPAMFTPPAPAPPVAGAIKMPDLRRLGESQARGLLAALGVDPGSIYVDYQTRSRIPDVFDQFAPYAVVSTLPAAGDWIIPGTTVVLGVRAPEASSEPAPGGQPAPSESPTPVPQPTAPAPTEEPAPQFPTPGQPQPGLPLPPSLPQPIPPGNNP
ncbi:MAG: transglycosylase domain-containing protein [Oscillochloridaceae bacterium]|nr:transglycosylase domain-containing protein [Chloroflexaceae bacterium]MDW8390873.1 transglycosylase domain-containing protein [Oscillochloridaceae bacterium]